MGKRFPSPGPGQVENRLDLGLERSGKGGFTNGFCPLEAHFLSVGLYQRTNAKASGQNSRLQRTKTAGKAAFTTAL